MPCHEFLEGLLGRPRTEAPLEPTKEQADPPLLPPELVDVIIGFVPPVVQEARYKTAMVGPKGVDVSLFGNYTVTFEGDVFVGGKANVHLTITDERKDGLTKFPTFDYAWVTEVIAISDKKGVLLARGDDECSYAINQRVVCGRLQNSLDDTCVPSKSASSSVEKVERRETSKTLRRSESF
jgi:hypothetical protein